MLSLFKGNRRILVFACDVMRPCGGCCGTREKGSEDGFLVQQGHADGKVVERKKIARFKT